MKADHEALMKVSELGILKSMESFLGEPLKPGRLKRRYLEVSMMVDTELRKIFAQDPNFYVDNKQEMTAYLEKFGNIMNTSADKKEDIHVASVVAFCLCFLEDTKSHYPEKLYEYLKDILCYYERGKDIKYSVFWAGRKFHEEWEKINNG